MPPLAAVQVTIMVVFVTAESEGVPAVGGLGAVAVNVAVAPVLVSVIVSVPFTEPTVSTAVPAVLLVIVGVPILAPVPPDSEKSPAAVSSDHNVFVPVKVRVGVVPVPPVVGLIAKVGVETEIVALSVSVVSVMVRVPVVPEGGEAADGQLRRSV